MRILACLVALFFCLSLVGCSWGRRAEIASTLLQMKSDEAQKQMQVSGDTESFLRAKRFLLEGGQAAALTRDDARRRFGDPASEFSGGSAWGYKPGTSDWLKGEKIFLYFDRNGTLRRWDYIPS